MFGNERNENRRDGEKNTFRIIHQDGKTSIIDESSGEYLFEPNRYVRIIDDEKKIIIYDDPLTGFTGVLYGDGRVGIPPFIKFLGNNKISIQYDGRIVQGDAIKSYDLAKKVAIASRLFCLYRDNKISENTKVIENETILALEEMYKQRNVLGYEQILDPKLQETSKVVDADSDMEIIPEKYITRNKHTFQIFSTKESMGAIFLGHIVFKITPRGIEVGDKIYDRQSFEIACHEATKEMIKEFDIQPYHHAMFESEIQEIYNEVLRMYIRKSNAETYAQFFTEPSGHHTK